MSRQDVDLIGVLSVCSMITQTGLPKFIIYRRGAARGTTPTFECRNYKSCEHAVRAFKDWANTIINANPDNAVEYDIVCYADEANSPENEANTKKDKMRFSFILGTKEPVEPRYMGDRPIYHQNENKSDIEERIKEAANSAYMKFKLEQLEKENKELKEEVEDLEDELESGGGGGNDLISGLMKLQGLSKPKEEAAINAPDSKEERSKRIVLAVNRIARYDAQLHLHLEKLADLAENKNATFKGLLSMLDQY